MFPKFDLEDMQFLYNETCQQNAFGIDMKRRISMLVSKLLYVQVVIIGIDFSGCKVNVKGLLCEKENPVTESAGSSFWHFKTAVVVHKRLG